MCSQDQSILSTARLMVWTKSLCYSACLHVQMDAWQHACGVVLPPAERAALIASGHAQVLSDTLSALDRENTAHAQARMRACACKIASSVPMASRPTEYSGGQVCMHACDECMHTPARDLCTDNLSHTW